MTARALAVAASLALLASSAALAQDVSPLDSAAQATAPRRRIFPVPVLGYTPETSLMFGAALVGVAPGAPDTTGRSPTRPTTVLLTAVYTLKRQYQLNVGVDRWTAGNGWHLAGSAGLERFPTQFHGIGASATDTSETYTPQHLILAAAAQRRVAPHLYAGLGYRLQHTRMVETEPLGRLAPGTVTGSRGGNDAMLTLDGAWDSRDLLYMTRRGGYLRVAFGVADPALGSDHAWRRYTADLRGYRATGNVVLAAQAVVDATDGNVPFEQLPRLGGQNLLRGYTGPRFLDGAMSAAQAEARVPLATVVSAVAFAGVGATAPSLRSIGDGPWRLAGGAGIRLLVDRANGLQLRVDYAFAKGGGALYVAAGDAF